MMWPMGKSIRIVIEPDGTIWDADEYKARQLVTFDDWEANLWALTTIVEPWEAHIYGFRSHLV